MELDAAKKALRKTENGEGWAGHEVGMRKKINTLRDDLEHCRRENQRIKLENESLRGRIEK